MNKKKFLFWTFPIFYKDWEVAPRSGPEVKNIKRGWIQEKPTD